MVLVKISPSIRLLIEGNDSQAFDYRLDEERHEPELSPFFFVKASCDFARSLHRVYRIVESGQIAPCAAPSPMRGNLCAAIRHFTAGEPSALRLDRLRLFFLRCDRLRFAAGGSAVRGSVRFCAALQRRRSW